MKKFLMATIMGAAVAFGAGSAMAQQKEIAVIVKSENANFWQNVKGGALDAAKELGAYEVTFQGPAAETDVVEQVNMVENAINRQVAGIVLAPSDPDGLVPTVKKAWENGIPVVIIDSALTKDADKYYQAFLATDNRTAGELAANMMLKKLDGKTGKVAMMSYVPGVGSSIGRDGGFKDVIEAAGNTVVGPFYSQSDMAQALNQTVDALASNNDLIGIFGSNEPTAIGMARAVKQQGYAGKMAVVGFDGDSTLQSFVRDGTLDGIVVQSSHAMGYKGVKTIDNLLKGNKVEKNIDTGVVYVTKDNIDSAEAKAVLY
nr:ABC transporter substrate-binding protein [uncultured Cohaesibacter sp.]